MTNSNGEQIFIAVVIALGIVGAFSATIGLAHSTLKIAQEDHSLGIFLEIFDFALIIFCVWAVINGIIKPLKKLHKK